MLVLPFRPRQRLTSARRRDLAVLRHLEKRHEEVRDALPELLAALREGTRALLVAPPGAGKTATVAPALRGRS